MDGGGAQQVWEAFLYERVNSQLCHRLILIIKYPSAKKGSRDNPTAQPVHLPSNVHQIAHRRQPWVTTAMDVKRELFVVPCFRAANDPLCMAGAVTLHYDPEQKYRVSSCGKRPAFQTPPTGTRPSCIWLCHMRSTLAVRLLLCRYVTKYVSTVYALNAAKMHSCYRELRTSDFSRLLSSRASSWGRYTAKCRRVDDWHE